MQDIVLFLALNLVLFNVIDCCNHETDPFSINRTKSLKPQLSTRNVNISLKNRLIQEANCKNRQLTHQYFKFPNHEQNISLLTHKFSTHQPQSLLLRKPRTATSTSTDPFYLVTRNDNSAGFHVVDQNRTNHSQVHLLIQQPCGHVSNKSENQTSRSNNQDNNIYTNLDTDFDQINNDSIQTLRSIEFDDDTSYHEPKSKINVCLGIASCSLLLLGAIGLAGVAIWVSTTSN